MSSNRRNRKARSNDHKPTSKDTIEKNYSNFIRMLPKRYKDAEDGQNQRIYRFLTECEALAQLAENDENIAEKLREGEFWSAHRQKCSKDAYVKIVVHHMMMPEGKTEQSKASKYVSVINGLRVKGFSGLKLFEKLAKDGIKNIYADSTGLTAKRATAAHSERGNCVQGPDDDIEEDLEQTAEEETASEPSDWVELGVLVRRKTLDKILIQKSEILKVKIGGEPISGKPKGYKRVVGRIYRAS